jgi:hypothetical protein
VADTAGSLDDLAARWGRYPDNRSNRGGSEPEVVDAVLFNGQAIAAVSLERANAVVIIDVSQPQTPTLLSLIPTGAAPEGVKLVARNQALYVLAANEVLRHADDRPRAGRPAHLHPAAHDDQRLPAARPGCARP